MENHTQGGIKVIKVEAIEQFTLEKFDKLSNVVRKNVDTKGKLYVGDVFECDDEMVKYLTGGNYKKKVVVKVLEVLPQEPTFPDLPTEEKPKKSYYKKKSDKK